MLSMLLGSRSSERILLFMLVNDRCYGSQLQRLLGLSLTPIQKALQRLEKAGIVVSYNEGKTKLYQLNSAYPLLGELEALLKKAYLLLPTSEKKQYHFARHNGASSNKEALNQQSEDRACLQTIWQRLLQVRQVTFHAKNRSGKEGSYAAKGRGEVIVTNEGSHCLIFHERGSWKKGNDPEIDFSNVYRWTLDEKAQLIGLEHLRHGPDRPVFLLFLRPTEGQNLESVDPHLCAEGTYFGNLRVHPHFLQLHWRLIGPKKNEEIDYLYA